MKYFIEDTVVEILKLNFSDYNFDRIHHIEILNQIYSQNFLEEGFSIEVIINNIKNYIDKNNIIPLLKLVDIIK